MVDNDKLVKTLDDTNRILLKIENALYSSKNTYAIAQEARNVANATKDISKQTEESTKSANTHANISIAISVTALILSAVLHFI